MRQVIAAIVALSLVGGPAAQAAGSRSPKGTVVRVPTGVVIVGDKPGSEGPRSPTGGAGGGGGGGACPGFRMGAIQAYVGGGEDGTPIYAITSYRCGADAASVQIFVCVANCPAGVETFIPPPAVPPLVDAIVALARRPVAVYAPPLHTGAFALVGKYLYFSVEPDSFEVVERGFDFPGGWYADATLTPTTLTMALDGHDAVSCDGPGPNPRDEAGRSASTCRVLVDRAPPKHRGNVTVSITWRIEVDSNIEGIADAEWDVDTTDTRTVDIKELQAVIVN